MSVTPYIPGADAAKIPLLEHVNSFTINRFSPRINWNLYKGKYGRVIIVL